LRVLWFWDEGRMILCTHGFVKKSRKTPPSEIARSLRMKANYEAAKQAKQLRLEAP
jgi:phage-related protein